MHDVINFITGPMVWISFAIFGMGIVFRLYTFYRLLNRTEKFVYSYLSVKHALKSIMAWLTPFMPQSTRIHPLFYGISYLFHLMLFLIPLFLAAHIILLEEAVQLSWISISDKVADIFTLFVIAAIVFFMVRRLVVPEVRFLTRVTDFLFLILVALPFITGFLAYHQFFAYQYMVILHVLSGELLLILIPFTRFFHMVLAPFTRGYMGSEFGYVRHAKDW